MKTTRAKALKPKFIIGNWKMNPQTHEEAKAIFNGIAKNSSASKKTHIIICPSFVHLKTVADLASKTSVEVGAQNFFYEQKGSYTGEISLDMISNAGAKYSLIGHSEQRKRGETDELINKKVLLALKNKIIPVICIGETVRDEEGNYYSIIREQIEKALVTVSKALLPNIIIAYEPVWAIGATTAMESRDVHEMTIFIKKSLIELFKIKDVSVPILYGGAVDPENARSIMTDGEADGLLIGRQSLVPESFSEIITHAQSL